MLTRGVVVVVGVGVRAVLLVELLRLWGFLGYQIRWDVVLFVTEVAYLRPVVLDDVFIILSVVDGVVVCWMEVFPATCCDIVGGDKIYSVFQAGQPCSRYVLNYAIP